MPPVSISHELQPFLKGHQRIGWIIKIRAHKPGPRLTASHLSTTTRRLPGDKLHLNPWPTEWRQLPASWISFYPDHTSQKAPWASFQEELGFEGLIRHILERSQLNQPCLRDAYIGTSEMVTWCVPLIVGVVLRGRRRDVGSILGLGVDAGPFLEDIPEQDPPGLEARSSSSCCCFLSPVSFFGFSQSKTFGRLRKKREDKKNHSQAQSRTFPFSLGRHCKPQQLTLTGEAAGIYVNAKLQRSVLFSSDH